MQTGMRPRPLEPDASMTKRAHWLDRRMMLASLLLLPLVAGPALATDQQPSGFVAAIYRLAMGPSGDGSDGGSVFADAANSKRFLSRRLRAALKAMLKRTPKGDAPVSISTRSPTATIQACMTCTSRPKATLVRRPSSPIFCRIRTRRAACSGIFSCMRRAAGRSTTSLPAARMIGKSQKLIEGP